MLRNRLLDERGIVESLAHSSRLGASFLVMAVRVTSQCGGEECVVVDSDWAKSSGNVTSVRPAEAS
jgi:hypothetical protein